MFAPHTHKLTLGRGGVSVSVYLPPARPPACALCASVCFIACALCQSVCLSVLLSLARSVSSRLHSENYGFKCERLCVCVCECELCSVYGTGNKWKMAHGISMSCSIFSLSCCDRSDNERKQQQQPALPCLACCFSLSVLASGS